MTEGKTVTDAFAPLPAFSSFERVPSVTLCASAFQSRVAQGSTLLIGVMG